MKSILQVAALVLIVGLVWFSVKKDRSTEFKYNLPITGASVTLAPEYGT